MPFDPGVAGGGSASDSTKKKVKKNEAAGSSSSDSTNQPAPSGLTSGDGRVSGPPLKPNSGGSSSENSVKSDQSTEENASNQKSQAQPSWRDNLVNGNQKAIERYRKQRQYQNQKGVEHLIAGNQKAIEQQRKQYQYQNQKGLDHLQKGNQKAIEQQRKQLQYQNQKGVEHLLRGNQVGVENARKRAGERATRRRNARVSDRLNPGSSNRQAGGGSIPQAIDFSFGLGGPGDEVRQAAKGLQGAASDATDYVRNLPGELGGFGGSSVSENQKQFRGMGLGYAAAGAGLTNAVLNNVKGAAAIPGMVLGAANTAAYVVNPPLSKEEKRSAALQTSQYLAASKSPDQLQRRLDVVHTAGEARARQIGASANGNPGAFAGNLVVGLGGGIIAGEAVSTALSRVGSSEGGAVGTVDTTLPGARPYALSADALDEAQGVSGASTTSKLVGKARRLAGKPPKAVGRAKTRVSPYNPLDEAGGGGSSAAESGGTAAGSTSESSLPLYDTLRKAGDTRAWLRGEDVSGTRISPGEVKQTLKDHFGGSDRGQADLSFAARDVGEEAPSKPPSFTDYNGGGYDVADAAKTQRRANAGTFEGEVSPIGTDRPQATFNPDAETFTRRPPVRSEASALSEASYRAFTMGTVAAPGFTAPVQKERERQRKPESRRRRRKSRVERAMEAHQNAVAQIRSPTPVGDIMTRILALKKAGIDVYRPHLGPASGTGGEPPNGPTAIAGFGGEPPEDNSNTDGRATNTTSAGGSPGPQLPGGKSSTGGGSNVESGSPPAPTGGMKKPAVVGMTGAGSSGTGAGTSSRPAVGTVSAPGPKSDVGQVPGEAQRPATATAPGSLSLEDVLSRTDQRQRTPNDTPNDRLNTPTDEFTTPDDSGTPTDTGDESGGFAFPTLETSRPRLPDLRFGVSQSEKTPRKGGVSASYEFLFPVPLDVGGEKKKKKKKGKKGKKSKDNREPYVPGF